MGWEGKKTGRKSRGKGRKAERPPLSIPACAPGIKRHKNIKNKK